MRRFVLLAVAALLVTGCGSDAGETTERAPNEPTSTGSTAPIPDPTTTTTITTTVPEVEPEPEPPASTTLRPDWLGTRVLPCGDDGFGEVQPTPPELADRRFATVDVLPPPATDAFEPVVEAVPEAVAARSTWNEACPVALTDLRYVTLPFWGFDGELHTGELLLHADAVDAVLAGFEALFDRGFPIEEMRITTPPELDAPPTGDGNNTGAFVCRATRGSGSWSDHAYGRAVDINPFHNPYVKGDLVLPELASTYADRSNQRPGMLTEGDVAGYTGAGWGWGGHWQSLKDHMHLSASGR